MEEIIYKCPFLFAVFYVTIKASYLREVSMSLKSYCTKRLLLFSILFSVLFAGLYAWYSIIAADALWADGFFINFLYFICDCTRTLFFSVILGYLAYGLHCFGFKGSISLFLVTLEMLLFYHLVTTVALAIPNASMDSLAFDDLVFEILFFAIFILLAFWISKKYPLKLCALTGSILWFLPTCLNNLTFDIQYGLPTSWEEWLQFFLYWFLDLLVFLVLPYLTMQFIFCQTKKWRP